MRCPICNKPMKERTIMTYAVIGGKRWSYTYEEMYCADHPQQAWQTPELFQANLDAIKTVKERAAAAKLKKATV